MPDIRKVGRELGVRYILQGSVRKAGNRVRVTAQLNEADTGRNIWADRYDRDLDDIFAVQDEITREIVTALEVTLSEGEQVRVWRRQGGDVAAYAHFIEGRELYGVFSRRTNAQARAKFEAAVRTDPALAIAYVHIGWTHTSDARFRWVDSPERSLSLASETAERALSIDEDLGDAYALRGAICLYRDEQEHAVAEGENAIRLNPNGAELYHMLGMFLLYAGRFQEATTAERQALRLNPLKPTNYLIELGHAYCQLGRPREAIEVLTSVVRERPHWQTARTLLAYAYGALQMRREMRTQVEEVLRINPRFSVNDWSRVYHYSNASDLERLCAGLEEAGLPR